jgi:hypothetical protein
MTNNIVFVNVTQTVAATPSTLQQTFAFVSQGGTTVTTSSTSFLTQYSDLTPLLATPLAISTLTWNTGTVTVTTALAHGLTNAGVYQLYIAGAVPAGYNGSFQCTVTGTSTFTYSLASNPGTETSPGTWVGSSWNELQQMATTWFAQGSANGVYVLELGESTIVNGPALLTTWLTNNIATVYGFMVPRPWDNYAPAQTAFITLASAYESTTSKTYFFTTTTNSTYTNYTNLLKSLYTKIEYSGKLSTEYDAAADAWNVANYNPSSTNKVTPLAFSYEYDVTPYPPAGASTLFAAWKAAGVNWVGTGSEGGISTAIIYWGTTMDVNPFNYWYSVDWVAINLDLQVANTIINGSNNPINPLYLNQDGINRLQTSVSGVMNSAVTFGLALGQVVLTTLDGPTFGAALSAGTFAGQIVINAVPFAPYYTANPGQYKTGTYNGLSVTFTPLRGFESVTINVNVTSVVAP